MSSGGGVLRARITLELGASARRAVVAWPPTRRKTRAARRRRADSVTLLSVEDLAMCRNPVHCITPPHVLSKLLKHKDPQVRESAHNTLLETARLRGQREVLAAMYVAAPEGGEHRTIYDAKRQFATSGKLVRDEGQRAAKDRAVNEVNDGFGATYSLYQDAFGRD